jgi:predicted GTPase
VAAVCDDVAGRLPAGSELEKVVRIRVGLDAPLRVAVAGRVNSGKSTLVNALLGARVAPTDEGECTRVVTWFQHGSEERAELRLRSGARRPLPLTARGGLPGDLGVDPAEVESVSVELQNDLLRSFTLIDTPGLESANEQYSVETERHLGIGVRDAVSRQAAGQAEALVFLLTPGILLDEFTALSNFRALFSGHVSWSLNAVGVLSQADRLRADPGADPWRVAGELAERYAAQLRTVVTTVVPLMGRMAESAWHLEEADARTLAVLAGLEERSRRRLLVTEDRFVAGEAPLAPAERRRLWRLLGGRYALERALALVAGGCSGAVALEAELRRISGLERLRELLLGSFARRAEVLKADWAVAALERLAYGWQQTALTGLGEELLDEVERLRSLPELHQAQLLRMLAGAEDLSRWPAERLEELWRLAAGASVQDKLGLDAAAPLAVVRARALERATAWNEVQDGELGWRRVAQEAAVSYTLLWEHAERLTAEAAS